MRKISNSKNQKSKIQNLFECWIVILIFGFWFLNSDGFASPASSAELIRNAGQHDGSEVIFEGELVGEAMRRDAFCWLNVHDGNNAIGVWARSAVLESIRHAGHYRVRGSRLEATGVFHRSCPEHGGGLDIHASKIVVLETGGPLAERLDPRKILILALLLGVLACLLKLYVLRKRRGPK